MSMSKFIKSMCVLSLVSSNACRMTNDSSLKERKILSQERHIVYLLAGQSNMAGQSPLSDDLRQLQVPNVEIFCVHPYKFEKDREVYRADQTRPLWETLRSCGSDPSSFGPELTFAAAAHKADPTAKIYLIKYAHGGTSLGCEWQPNRVSPAYARYGIETCQRFLKATGKPDDSVRTYKRLIAAVNWGLEGLTQRGITPKVAGMLWFQGESDADGRTDFRFLADSYAENLPHFVRNLRADLKVPEMPFVLGKIKCGYTVAEWNKDVNPLEIIRGAQQKLADTEPFVYAFDSLDLGFQADNCHFDSPSMKIVGERFAMALKRGQEELAPPEP